MLSSFTSSVSDQLQLILYNIWIQTQCPKVNAKYKAKQGAHLEFKKSIIPTYVPKYPILIFRRRSFASQINETVKRFRRIIHLSSNPQLCANLDVRHHSMQSTQSI